MTRVKKWTEGEWDLDRKPNGHCGWTISFGSRELLATVYCDELSTSRDADSEWVYGGNAESVANAHLISAAPELVENHISVCEQPILWKDDADFDEHGGYYALSKGKYDAMCAALAKAYGETP